MLFSLYEYPNPSDHKETLQNINDAIVAYASGWSVIYNCVDREWATDDSSACNDGVGGVYGFMSGVPYKEHHNLAFETDGYGSQKCHVRMRANEEGSYGADPNVEYIECGAYTNGKEVIDRDTIWLVYYDEDNDELFRMRVEKVKERWEKEAEYYADKYNDEKEGYR